MWALFNDMYSGGAAKTKWTKIYLEVESNIATEIFERIFKINPENATCNCCGPNYSLMYRDSLQQLSGFSRGCKYDPRNCKCIEVPNFEGYISFEDWASNIPGDTLVLNSNQIMKLLLSLGNNYSLREVESIIASTIDRSIEDEV